LSNEKEKQKAQKKAPEDMYLDEFQAFCFIVSMVKL